MRKKLIVISLLIVTVLLLFLAAAWSIILFSKDPTNNILGKSMPWPVVCTFKGCITTTEWIAHHKLENNFAESVDADIPTTTESLTTLTRQHIARESFLKSPVTRSGTKRYREEILNLRNEEQLKEVVDMSLREYDELIVMPWLEQEALRQEHDIESADELFSKLSKDTFIIVWPFAYSWNKTSGKIEKK